MTPTDDPRTDTTELRTWEVHVNVRGEACVLVEAKSKTEAKKLVKDGAGGEWMHWDIYPTKIRDVRESE